MQVTLPRQEHHIQDLLHTKTNHSRLHCIFAKLTDITMLLLELEVNFNNNMKQTISKDLKLFGMSFAHLLLSDLSMCDTFFPLAACTCISTNKECILGKPNMRKNPTQMCTLNKVFSGTVICWITCSRRKKISLPCVDHFIHSSQLCITPNIQSDKRDFGGESSITKLPLFIPRFLK